MMRSALALSAGLLCLVVRVREVWCFDSYFLSIFILFMMFQNSRIDVVFHVSG